jgi:hypothetical protein
VGTDLEAPFLGGLQIDFKADLVLILVKSNHTAGSRKPFQVADRQDGVSAGMLQIGRRAIVFRLGDEQYLAFGDLFGAGNRTDRYGTTLYLFALHLLNGAIKRAFAGNAECDTSVAAK